METMTVDQILQAIGNLRSADRVRLVSRMAPTICRAAMEEPEAITMMLAECRRACREPEAQRRMGFAMEIMRRMKGGS
jgi:uncharacterized protein YjgD (DUF1641 family)